MQCAIIIAMILIRLHFIILLQMRLQAKKEKQLFMKLDMLWGCLIVKQQRKVFLLCVHWDLIIRHIHFLMTLLVFPIFIKEEHYGTME